VSDFTLARQHAFSKEEKRRFQDIRRSANLAADLGDASTEEHTEMFATTSTKTMR